LLVVVSGRAGVQAGGGGGGGEATVSFKSVSMRANNTPMKEIKEETIPPLFMAGWLIRLFLDFLICNGRESRSHLRLRDQRTLIGGGHSRAHGTWKCLKETEMH
jgi:hypothetical protein